MMGVISKCFKATWFVFVWCRSWAFVASGCVVCIVYITCFQPLSHCSLPETVTIPCTVFDRVRIMDFLPSLFLLHLYLFHHPFHLLSLACWPLGFISLHVSSFFRTLPQASVFCFFIGLFCHRHLCSVFATDIFVQFSLSLLSIFKNICRMSVYPSFIGR